MIVFYIIEVSLMLSIYISLVIVKNDKTLYILELIIINIGIQPIQQAFLIFYLKSSKDPLEAISKLDALCLVSQT